jgi:protein-L-isoaspartate(D-aspartate) O-methyltransferase
MKGFSRIRRTVLTADIVLIAICTVLSSAGCSSGERAYGELRERMVRRQIIARGVDDSLVVAAMRAVPRHRFVPADVRSHAYVDSPLPIGLGQTISQPYIVALMTEALRCRRGERVLEIGTGSGYQAAVLAEIVDTVFTIEIIPELARRARAVLDTLGYRNVMVRTGDGYDGWPEAAPFDGIIVTAAAPEVPRPLVDQLAEGGRLVIPVGEHLQYLHVYEKRAGALALLSSVPVRFVPMTGKVRTSRGE